MDNEKIMKCAENFLIRRNYEILAIDMYDADIIAFDNDEYNIVFIKVNYGYRNFTQKNITRKEFENMIIDAGKDDFFELYKFATVRFDTISICVLSENKATLKHHVNVFGTDDNAEY